MIGARVVVAGLLATDGQTILHDRHDRHDRGRDFVEVIARACATQAASKCGLSSLLFGLLLLAHLRLNITSNIHQDGRPFRIR